MIYSLNPCTSLFASYLRPGTSLRLPLFDFFLDLLDFLASADLLNFFESALPVCVCVCVCVCVLNLLECFESTPCVCVCVYLEWGGET